MSTYLTNQEFEDRIRDMNDTAESQSALLTTLITSSAQVELKPAGQAQASVSYTRSADGEVGWVMCEHLADAPDGMVYQVWFNEDTVSAPAVAFTPEDGDCLLPVDLTSLTMAPTGVGISLEESGVTSDGPEHWLAYAHFPIQN